MGLGGLLLASAIALLVLISSPTTIVPPDQPTEPTIVYVVDYGMHSRLVLPDGEGGLVQYTYGDWRYFALEDQNLVTAAQALLWPTPATLGRRSLTSIWAIEQSFRASQQQHVLAVGVSGVKVTELRSQLNTWFTYHIDTQVHHPASHLHFVKVDEAYTILHNSNHELVAWLKALNCQVNGFVAWPNFRVTP